MKQKIIALFLTLCLCLGLVPAVSAAGPTLEDSVDMDLLVSHAIQMYLALEGKYNSVTPKDSNACSIGFMQWHGEGARDLLKMICASDPILSEEILGTEFFEEINVGSNSWKNRILTSAEASLVSTLIDTAVGHQCQDLLARQTIVSEVKTGWKRGVRTEPGLLYYSSIENQFGIGGANNCMGYLRETIGFSASDTFDSLLIFHNAWLQADATGNYPNSISKYKKARVKVFNFIVNTLGLYPGTTPFIDLPAEGHWAHDPIEWAYTHNPQITAGTNFTTFSPDAVLTRGEAVTFLWAAAGKPNPSSSHNPFQDVKSDRFYYTAVLWAVEKGFVAGRTPTDFCPAESVTRGEMITLLWAYSGKPKVTNVTNPYTDVSSGRFYYNPVLWAVSEGLFVGNEGGGSPDLLYPKTPCSRAYVVTYMYNLLH